MEMLKNIYYLNLHKFSSNISKIEYYFLIICFHYLRELKTTFKRFHFINFSLNQNYFSLSLIYAKNFDYSVLI